MGMTLNSTIMTAAAKNAIGDRHQAEGRRAHRCQQYENRHQSSPHASKQQWALGEREQSEVSKEFRKGVLISLNDDDIAKAQRHRPQTLVEPFTLPADGEQVHVETVVEQQVLGRPTDHA